MYSNDEITNSEKEIAINDKLGVGLRTGYRFMPFRTQRENLQGFYFTPFVSPVFIISENLIFTNGEEFKSKNFQLWGGIHLGWRINLLK